LSVWERVATALALASPAFLVVNMGLSVLDPGGGMGLVYLTTTGNALYGGLVAGATFLAARDLLRDNRTPSGMLVVSLALAVILAAIEPARLVPLLISLASIHQVRRRNGTATSCLADVLVAGAAGLGVLGLVVFSAFASDGVEIISRTRNLDSPWSFVIVDADQGGTGGSTVGYAELPLGGVATIQTSLYRGELGARPDVSWVGARTLRIGSTQVDPWNGPTVDEDY